MRQALPIPSKFGTEPSWPAASTGLRSGAHSSVKACSHRRDGSKIALTYLTHRLQACGFSLFDTQFITPHLRTLGAVEIARTDYHKALRKALTRPAEFDASQPFPSPEEVVVQRNTQTS